MTWVRFTADFDWKPKRSVTIGYKAEMVLNVPAAAARAAIKARKVVTMQKDHRDSEPQEVTSDDS